MSEQGKSLLVIKAEKALTQEQHQTLLRALTPVADQAGIVPVVLDDCLDAGVHADIAPTLRDLVAEQKQTNQLLMMLIEALSEEEEDPDSQPMRYMDGSAV